MAQIKDGAKRGWRKARMLHNKDDTKHGWCKARMVQRKDDGAKQG